MLAEEVLILDGTWIGGIILAIPKFHSFLLPFLEFTSDGKEHSFNEVVDYIVKHFNITDEESAALLPSGKQTILHNRITWARTEDGSCPSLSHLMLNLEMISSIGQ